MKRPFPKPPKDVPLGTRWFGGPISWFSISLTIRAADLVPEDVTRLLQVQPTRSRTKGSTLSTRANAPVAKVGSWALELTSSETDEWDVTEAVRLLIKRLPHERAVWRSLPADAQVRLSFGLHLETGNQGFSLAADILQFAADRSIDLDFHIYHEGTTSQDDADQADHSIMPTEGMNETATRDYYRGRWPEEPVPDGVPIWLLYEVDKLAGTVLRTVDVFADGRITRDSVELEQRYGDKCPSLIDCSLDVLFAGGHLEEIPREQFEGWWTKGVDTPFWFVR